MPIIVPVFDPNAPLSQGDLLKGVSLFYSAKPALAATPASALSKAAYCLVISRPCVTAHKDQIVVAAVTHNKDDVLDRLKDYKIAKKFYADVRDGKSSPDLFYLGQLEGEKGSFSARLDSLHTIELPVEPGARQPFVASVRVACLDAAFAHDLHQRLFRAFASLGFDDDAWYPTADLDVLVALGERDLANAQSAYQTALAVLKAMESQSEKKDKELNGRQKDVATARAAVEQLDRELAPLRAELKRRPSPLPAGGALKSP